MLKRERFFGSAVCRWNEHGIWFHCGCIRNAVIVFFCQRHERRRWT